MVSKSDVIEGNFQVLVMLRRAGYVTNRLIIDFNPALSTIDEPQGFRMGTNDSMVPHNS